jgi:hypothetical protein
MPVDMALPLVVGLVIWLPALLVWLLVRGRWSTPPQGLAAATAVLAFLVPGAANARPGGAGLVLAAWSIALAPLLALLGSFAQLYLTAVMSNNRPRKFHERLSTGVIMASGIAAGLLLHCFLRHSAPTP